MTDYVVSVRLPLALCIVVMFVHKMDNVIKAEQFIVMDLNETKIAKPGRPKATLTH